MNGRIVIYLRRGFFLMVNKRNTIIVAEVGINHGGSLDIAKQLIDVAKDTGCDYVKFQKRTIEDVYTKEFLDSPRESPWGKTQRDQKNGLEFTLEQYKEIDKYCKEKGIPFFVSSWDVQSISFIESNFSDMPYLKIPSAKVTDEIFLNKCKESKFDLIMGTGMSDLTMVQKAISSLVKSKKLKFILGCTSSYPTPLKDINLNQIRFLSYYFKTPYCDIGWSDHTGGILFPSLAVSHGAKMIEIHVTLDRKMYGTDQASSLEPEGLRHLVKYIEAIELGMGEPNKTIQESELLIIKKLRGI